MSLEALQFYLVFQWLQLFLPYLAFILWHLLEAQRIVTDDICAVCYVNDDLVTPNETRKTMDLAGKTPLTICRGCFESGVEPPFSTARTNIRRANEQANATKKRKNDGAVEAGKRKSRVT